MISPLECYSDFIIKINKNSTGAGKACPKSKFVVIFNEAKNRWVDQALHDKNSILIDRLQEILVTEEFIEPSLSDEYVEFDFTPDFYEFNNAQCTATKRNCTRTIRLREIKTPNKQILYFDEDNKPSFEYEWSFLTIQDNKIRVYRTDFNITQLYVEYYKLIPDIDLEGYTHFDGTSSTNIGIELSKQYVDQIINRAAEEFMRNYENQIGLSIAKDRTKSET